MLSEQKIDSVFEERGLFRFKKSLLVNLKEFQSNVQAVKRKAAEDSFSTLFEFLPSCLYDRKSAALSNLEGVVIDIGGTRTRIVQFLVKDEVFSCTRIIHFVNSELTPLDASSDSRISVFFGELVRQAKILVQEQAEFLKNIAIIWSNAATSQIVSSSIISNIVKGVGNGKDYRKGEWFIEGLRDGDNLGEIFLSECKKHDVSVERLIMSNDTVFVGFAEGSADAGGVISTGANMAVKFPVNDVSDLSQWYNLECGTNFKVLTESVSTLKADQSDLSIQSLIAGRWLAHRYLSLLVEVVSILGQNLVPLRSVNNIDAQWYSGIGKLSSKDEMRFHLREIFEDKDITDEVVFVAKRLSEVFTDRIIAFSAVLVGGVAQRSNSKILVDSRVLEGLDPSLSALRRYLAKLELGNLEIKLIRENAQGIGGGIIGAARALLFV